MICEICQLMLQAKLYRCVECYKDKEPSDMCKSCKREHIDANMDLKKALEPQFIEVVY